MESSRENKIWDLAIREFDSGRIPWYPISKFTISPTIESTAQEGPDILLDSEPIWTYKQLLANWVFEEKP